MVLRYRLPDLVRRRQMLVGLVTGTSRFCAESDPDRSLAFLDDFSIFPTNPFLPKVAAKQGIE